MSIRLWSADGSAAKWLKRGFHIIARGAKSALRQKIGISQGRSKVRCMEDGSHVTYEKIEYLYWGALGEGV